MYLSPEAQRLLDDIRRAHERLIAHFSAGEAHRRAFRAVYEAIESGVGDVSEEEFEAPIGAGWSRAQILVHVAEHDQKIEEATREGVEHMIEHGFEHARSLWLARAPAQG
jgi:hypothetical protein